MSEALSGAVGRGSERHIVKRLCKIDECDREHAGRGYCQLHYNRWKRNGDPLVVKERGRARKVCSVDGCDKPHTARGWCRLHYRQWRDKGGLEVRLCTVDKCDNPHMARGYCGKHYNRWRRTGQATRLRRERIVEDPDNPYALLDAFIASGGVWDAQ